MVEKALETYKMLFKLRENANSLLLSRISIFVAIQAAIISFIANTFDKFIVNYSSVLVIVELFGLIASFFMVYLVRSSILWLNYWDNELKEIESDALGKYNIFRTHPYVNEDKKKEIGRGKSTRTAMLLFSRAFSLVWIGVLIYTFFIILN